MMPKKKKGKKKKGGKGKGKGKAKLQAATERDEQVKAMRCLIKAYLSRKSLADSPSRVIVSGQIVQDLTICAEEEKLFIKVCTILIRSVLVAMTVSHLSMLVYLAGYAGPGETVAT